MEEKTVGNTHTIARVSECLARRSAIDKGNLFPFYVPVSLIINCYVMSAASMVRIVYDGERTIDAMLFSLFREKVAPFESAAMSRKLKREENSTVQLFTPASMINNFVLPVDKQSVRPSLLV